MGVKAILPLKNGWHKTKTLATPPKKRNISPSHLEKNNISPVDSLLDPDTNIDSWHGCRTILPFKHGWHKTKSLTTPPKKTNKKQPKKKTKQHQHLTSKKKKNTKNKHHTHSNHSNIIKKEGVVEGQDASSTLWQSRRFGRRLSLADSQAAEAGNADG